MQKLLTVLLFMGVCILSTWSYNTNINCNKITSLEQTIKNDAVGNILKGRIETKKQFEINKAKKIRREQEKQKRLKEISRGEVLPKLIPITVIATAYAPYDNKSGICNDGSPDSTAIGSKPKLGCIAADPKELPYGTKLLIPSYLGKQICTVEDTGGALRRDKNNIRIDLYMDTYEEAMEWGRQEITVYIIQE